MSSVSTDSDLGFLFVKKAVYIKDFVRPERYLYIEGDDDCTLGGISTQLFGAAGGEYTTGSGQLVMYNSLTSSLFSVVDDEMEASPLSLFGGVVVVGYPEMPAKMWDRAFNHARIVELTDRQADEDVIAYISSVRNGYMLELLQPEGVQCRKESRNLQIMDPRSIIATGATRSEAAEWQSHRIRVLVRDFTQPGEHSDVVEISSDSTVGKLWSLASVNGLLPIQLLHGSRPIAHGSGISARSFFGSKHSVKLTMTGKLFGGGKRGSTELGGASDPSYVERWDDGTSPEEIFGGSDLTEFVIKLVYRKLSAEVHPDKHGNHPGATRDFRRLTDAKEVLLNEALGGPRRPRERSDPEPSQTDNTFLARGGWADFPVKV